MREKRPQKMRMSAPFGGVVTWCRVCKATAVFAYKRDAGGWKCDCPEDQ
jgi:hypothetical protein